MEKQIEEIWKPVLDYEGFYEVSDMGRIKSFHRGKETILNPSVSNYGYLQLYLCKNGTKKTFKVNRLVYEAFYGKTELQVDHKVEGNKLDNSLLNLQALTNRENTSKSKLFNKTSSKYTGVSWNKKTNKWNAKIRIDGKLKHLGYFTDELEAANAYQNALKSL